MSQLIIIYKSPYIFSVYISLLFFHFNKILSTALMFFFSIPIPFTLPFYSPVLPFPFLAANFSQSHPRFPSPQPSVVTSLNFSTPPRHISLCPSSDSACFPVIQITVSRATFALRCAVNVLTARHPQCSCSLRNCRAAVIFVRVEQCAFSIRYSANVTPIFCYPCRHSYFATLLFFVSVSHVCAFHVRGYLECTPCPGASRIGVCRDIFVYAGKLGNSIVRYAF